MKEGTANDEKLKSKYVKRRSLSSVEIIPKKLKRQSSRHSSCDFSGPVPNVDMPNTDIGMIPQSFPFPTLVPQNSFNDDAKEKETLRREVYPNSFQAIWPYPTHSPQSAVSTPARRSLPHMRADFVALNHMPKIKYTKKLIQELQQSDTWDVVGSVFVKHSGVRSLILQLAKPLRTDLTHLTLWSRKRLKSSKPTAALASQAQIMEFNNLKQDSIRKNSGSRRKSPARVKSSKSPKTRKERNNRRQDAPRNGQVHKSSTASSTSTKSHKSSGGRNSLAKPKSNVGSCSSTQSQSDDQSQSHSDQEHARSSGVKGDDSKEQKGRNTMPRSVSETNRKAHRDKDFYKNRELSYPPVGFNVYGMAMRPATGIAGYGDQNGSQRDLNLELLHRDSSVRSTKDLFLQEGLNSPHHPQSIGMREAQCMSPHYNDSPSFHQSVSVHRQQSTPKIYHHNNWHNWNQRPVNWSLPKTESLNSPRQHNVHVINPWTNQHPLPARFYKDKYRADRRRVQSGRPRRGANEHIKCLLLAMEGVLTTTEEGPNLPRHIQDMTVKLAQKLCLLKHIICLTGCKLVLISVARLDPSLVEFINNIFKSWGIAPFYSKTPSIRLDKALPEAQRVEEVKRWLTSHNNVMSWCVVDAMDLGALNNGKKRTVMLDGRKGLTREKARTILEILGVDQDLYR